MLSVLMQVFVVTALIYVLWAVYGYSVAFTGGSPFLGGLDKIFLSGVTPASTAATFSKGVVIPEFTYLTFQATFAAITCALIVGSFAERIRFSAVLLFCVLWFTFSYLPIAHMVWYWDGPDAISDAKIAGDRHANAGWLWAKGALDFAGGTVVHINAGVAGLVGAFLVGKRVGYGREALAPHSLTLTMVGASLLWVGWFGFNAAPTWKPTAAPRWPSPTRCSPPPPPPCPGSRGGAAKGKASLLGAASAPSPAWWRSRRPAASSASWARS